MAPPGVQRPHVARGGPGPGRGYQANPGRGRGPQFKRCVWCGDTQTGHPKEACWVYNPVLAEEYGTPEWMPADAGTYELWESNCFRINWWPPSMRAAELVAAVPAVRAPVVPARLGPPPAAQPA
jgi:hypothetical protein